MIKPQDLVHLFVYLWDETLAFCLFVFLSVCLFLSDESETLAQTKCSTCQCFPRAVTTLSSIGRLKILSEMTSRHHQQRGSPAGAADGNSHLVVAAQAVELVQLVGRVAGARSHLSGEKNKLENIWTEKH